jgi:predicted phage gp36 major capsid-like protein
MVIGEASGCVALPLEVPMADTSRGPLDELQSVEAEMKALREKRSRILAAAQSSLWTDVAAGQPSLLLGKAVIYASNLDSTVVSGSSDAVCVLGGWSQAVIVDRIPVQVMWFPCLVGDSGRPTGTGGWCGRWRTTSGVFSTSGFRYLEL